MAFAPRIRARLSLFPPSCGTFTTRQASRDATDRPVAPPYRAFDTGLRSRRSPLDNASLLRGLLTVTPTGLAPASDDEHDQRSAVYMTNLQSLDAQPRKSNVSGFARPCFRRCDAAKRQDGAADFFQPAVEPVAVPQVHRADAQPVAPVVASIVRAVVSDPERCGISIVCSILVMELSLGTTSARRIDQLTYPSGTLPRTYTRLSREQRVLRGKKLVDSLEAALSADA